MTTITVAGDRPSVKPPTVADTVIADQALELVDVAAACATLRGERDAYRELLRLAFDNVVWLEDRLAYVYARADRTSDSWWVRLAHAVARVRKEQREALADPRERVA